MIGAQLGHYRILDEIGAGGMGVVYRAEDPRLRRTVAIKVLPPAFAGDPERQLRFEREARAAGSLNHPALLTIFDVGQHEGSPYIVCELLEGETLRERLKHGPLPHGKAVDLAVQIARGLAAAHAKGVVHRDLKPENLFITREGRLKILDFGLAKLLRHETSGAGTEEGSDSDTVTAGYTLPGTIMGTASYMSPEQVRGENADARSDLFALGAILYEMLAGERAFHRGTAVETWNSILTEEPQELATIRSEVPQPLARIVRLCLEKSREERFQSAHDVALALEAFTAVSAAGSEAGRASRWRPRLMVPLALLCIAVGIAGERLVNPDKQAASPSFQRLTFRRGYLGAARFTADGQTIVYSAAWDGDPLRLFTTRPGSAESSALDLPPANIMSISASGEMLLQLRTSSYFGLNLWIGTLARASLAGGAPREIAEDVAAGDWSPDGSRIAVVRRSSGTFRLEFPIGELLYETHGYISEPRVSAEGDRVAFLDHPVPNDDAASVKVVDLAGNVRTLSAGWVSATGLAWSPQGDEIWFSAAEKGSARKLHAVSLEGEHRMLWPTPGGVVLFDVSQRGPVLLVDENLTTSILGTAPGEVRERDLSWLDWSRPRDLSSDGRTLLFSEFGEGAGPRYAVCLRKTNGSPVVRLGEGAATALSPDGKWALAILHSPTMRLQVLPTAAGEPRVLEAGPIERYQFANWMPDGRRIVIAGVEPGHGMRCYLQDMQGGLPRPITPEGTSLYFPCSPVSPDGELLIAKDAQDKPMLYPLDGSEPRPILGLTSADWPICWSADGRFIHVQRSGEIPARIERLDPRTGLREAWKTLAPADLAGVVQLSGVRIAPEESAFVYNLTRLLHDLYLVEDMR